MEVSKIVKVIGQMNVDIVYQNVNRFPKLGEEVFASDMKISLGGGPMVVPIQLDRLGVDVRLGTYIGNDYQSRISTDLLNAIHFDKIEVLATTKKHPVVVTSVISTPAERSFVCYNEGANELDAGAQAVFDFYKDASVCFCPQDVKVAKQLKSLGKVLVYDTGWHDDLSIASIKDYLEVVDYFTPNEKEAEKLCGTDDFIACLDILKQFTKTPIIKLGVNGCLVKIDNQYIHVPKAADFKTIDPTGAGDNFLTGLIYGIINDEKLIDCVKYGNILGGLSTEVLGCYRSDINVSMLEKYYAVFPACEVVTS